MNPPHLAIVRQKCQIYDTLLRPVTKQQQQNTGGIGANKKRDKQKWGKRCSRSPSNGSYAVKYLFYFGFNSSLFRKEVKKKKKGKKKKNNMATAAISHVKISILLRFWRKEWNSILNKGFEFSTNRQCESCVGIIKGQMWEAQVKIQQWRFLKGQGLLRHEFALEETQLRSTFEWHNENRQVLKQTKNYVFHSPRGEWKQTETLHT